MTWQNIAWCGRGDGSYTQCQSSAYVLGNHSAVIVDLFDTSAATIASLKAGGRRVICYYSAGTWENWRVDKDNLTSVKRAVMDGWVGEWWLDLTSAANRSVVQAAMTWRLQLAQAKGCEAVEPDNVDCFGNTACRQGRALADAKADQLAYNQWTAGAAHAHGLAVGLKNDLDQVAALEPLYDFAVNEECRQYNECNVLLPFLNHNKAVFQTAYQGYTEATLTTWCESTDKIGRAHV